MRNKSIMEGFLSEMTEKGYKPIKMIGEGAFGKVFAASSSKNKVVAIKTIRGSDKYIKREIGIMQKLNHINCLPLIDYCLSKQDTAGIVMDMYPNTLLTVLRMFSNKGSRFPLFYIKLFTYQIFAGLDHMHLKGFVHRDIKPENLLVDYSTGSLVIADFGSARKFKSGSTMASYVTSRFYRAPELINGSTFYGPEIDIWSVGCVIGEMLRNGIPLFTSDSAPAQLEIISDVINNQTLPEKLIIRVPPDLLDLLNQVLSLNPKKRPSASKCMNHQFFDELFAKGVTLPNGGSLPKLSRRKND